MEGERNRLDPSPNTAPEGETSTAGQVALQQLKGEHPRPPLVGFLSSDPRSLEHVASGAVKQKLSALSLRIQQIETTLNILDAKLSSIPGLEDVKVETHLSNSITNGHLQPRSVSEAPPATPQTEVVQQNSLNDNTLPKEEVQAENIPTVAKDPRYARYLKMVQVGVPVMAIRNKMISEGLNPDLLETPNAPVPDGDIAPEDSSDSESSFSD
ncbi:WASH complex subunit 3 isoform X1 [Bufo bufo]|uniref:WASH complex subunit 3 isoform X1 n=1 Tax=Bufo bufo TaxID=8384 RepID=UPI001ABE35CE|nr:WASH complex subunit 3 isoform X1 [Bufo bufo]